MKDYPWWKKTIVYQIYPRSFKDSTGNGIGDLDGIISKLDYLKDLGIETIWFCPFYPSPQKDFGYGISNFKNVDPIYGTLETCDKLIRETHSREMKIIFDITLTHTADTHPWFIESRSNLTNAKRDWYIWKKGKKPNGKKPPNNWRSVTLRSGWRYDEITEEWYWARYFPFHPELNFRNHKVQEEMMNALRFWLEKGIDGFRLDVIDNLFVDSEFKNSPFLWKPVSMNSGEFLFRSNKMLNHLPETISFMKTLRQVINGFKDQERFLVGEVEGPIETLQRYCSPDLDSEIKRSEQNNQNQREQLITDGLNLVFIFESLSIPLKSGKIKKLIQKFEKYFKEPLIPTIVFGNHDRMRRISKINNSIEKAKLNFAFQSTIRAVPFIYYGEEIGMEQARIPIKQSMDPMTFPFKKIPQFIFDFVKKVVKESINRDECRTPMQWNTQRNAGFCPENIDPWLPVHPSFKDRNVQTESEKPNSLLNCYKRFIDVRKKVIALNSGSIEMISNKNAGIPKDVLHYKRIIELNGVKQQALIFLNFSKRELMLKSSYPNAKFVVSTTIETKNIPKNLIYLKPWEGIVLLEEN